MNQELRRYKIVSYKKNFFFIFVLISLILNSCFVTLIPPGFADQNLSVSATVPPHASDFQFAFASTDGQTSVPQGTTLSYQITYGARASAGVTTTTTLVADYSADTAPDNSQVLDYVIGSADNAYGGAAPVVDLTRHTITWTIPNLPSGTTDQTVTFQLRTNSNYSGADPVNFTIRAEMSNQYVSMPDQTISQTYQFDQSLVTPTPTLTPIPTTTPKPTPIPTTIPNTNITNTLAPTSIPTPQPTGLPTTTPTPSPKTLQVTTVSFTGISPSSVHVEIDTNKPTTLIITYGTSPTSLTKTITTSQYQEVNAVTISGLVANTSYYFTITATDQSGQTINSEVFTFQTAKTAPVTYPESGTAIITSNGNILLSEILKQNMTPGFAILTTNTGYELTISLAQPDTFTSLAVVVKKKTPINTVSFVEEQPNTYIAHLKTFDSGTYELFLQSTDTHGNITEQKIADLKVTPHLSVYAKESQLPLSDARVYLYYYDTKSNSYKPLSQELFGAVTNPSYTDSRGEINTLLPRGKYRVDASALFYDKETVDFIVGPANGQEFPRIYLTRNPFNLFSLFTFAKDIFLDTINNLNSALHAVATSVRLFHVIAISVTGSFGLLSFLLFLLKSHSTAKHIPLFLLFGVDMLLKKHKQKYVFGSIVDEQEQPLSQVQIQIEDAETKKIITHITTNKTGKFYFANTFTGTITLIFTKDGYGLKIISLPKNVSIPDDGLKISLTKTAAIRKTASILFVEGVKNFGGMLFETFLMLSIILEVLFFFMYGFLSTTPFLLLSLFNIILWLFYIHQRSAKTLL